MFEQQSQRLPEESNPVESRVPPSITEDLVEIPAERRHFASMNASTGGILLSLVVTTIASAGLGAGYGAFIALCGKIFVNIPLAFAFAFWMSIPAGLGLMCGRVRDARWRNRVGLLGFLICLYFVCVGWLAAVLEGPGLVFHPFLLVGHLLDVSHHGIWVEAWGLEKDLIPLQPYLLAVRIGSLSWLLLGGLLSIGAESPFPFCSECQRWMDDEVTLRVQYQPTSADAPQILAAEWVAEQYAGLYALDRSVADDEKGLELTVHSCERCDGRHVLNAKWYRPLPDAAKSATEQLLESGLGTKLVSGLLVPSEVRSHVAQLTESKAA